MQIHTLNLIEVRDALAKGELSAEAVTKACLTQIEASEPQIRALLAHNDHALEEARLMDKEGPKPHQALWGVPFTIKDVLCTKGLTTTAGSKMLENFVPSYDAHVIEKLREAGAIILAKNNMDEFAMGSTTENSAYHPTHNPHNLACVPGGSSGGSAASVVAHQCFASLGSDTGGSIRQPASLCGCVGLKPTYGRVSRYGAIAYGSSLDQIGPLARSVADCALVLETIAGHDPRDGTSDPRPIGQYVHAITSPDAPQDLKGLRIGVPKEFFGEGLAEEVRTVCEHSLERMKELGAELVSITMPHTNAAIATYYIVAMAEASSNLARYDGVRYGYRSDTAQSLAELYVQSRTEGLGQEVQRRIMLGTYVLSSGYYDAYFRKAAQVRSLIAKDYEEALQKCHVICGPVSPVTAWKLGSLTEDPLQMYLKDIYTLSLNLAGLPGLALPAGIGKDSNLPVGIQLLGKAFDEENLLRIGQVIEQHMA